MTKKQEEVPEYLRHKLDWDPTEHYKNTEVAQQYDASRFSGLPGRVFLALERRCLLKAFRTVAKGSTIVDVPCGTGRLAEILLEAGHNVVGMDISPEMLAVARRRLARFGNRFTTKVCDARTLVNSTDRYDAALCARVLMHFPLDGQIEFLKGVAHVTTGPVVFTQSFDSPYQRLRRRLKHLWGHQAPSLYPIDSDEIELLLAGAGLRKVKQYHLLSPVSESIAVVGSQKSRT